MNRIRARNDVLYDVLCVLVSLLLVNTFHHVKTVGLSLLKSHNFVTCQDN